MDEAWKQLPRAAVIVCASVLAAGAERSARAESPAAADREPNAELAAEAPPKAPTCGAACHGGMVEPVPVEPDPVDRVPVAPTCGAACHGGYEPPDPIVAPPPVEPAKKGCAVEDSDDHSPLGLALLGIGLLAGVAGRRRREDDPSA